MSRLTERKTKLSLETPLEIQRRALIAEVQPWGLSLRLKGQRRRLQITWNQVYTRAAIIAADERRAKRKEAHRGSENPS